MDNKLLRRTIIIVGVVVILLIILILNLTKNEDSVSEDNTIEYKEEYASTIGKTFRKIDDFSMYYTAKNIIKNYITYFENVNSDVTVEVGRVEMTEKEIRDYQIQEGIKAIDCLFDKEYKESKNIDRNEIISFVAQYKNNNSTNSYKIEFDEIYIAEITDDKKVLLVYSKVNNKDFNCMIKVDLMNKRYSIFYEDFMKKEKYTKDRTDEVKLDDSNIEQNDYNTFIYSSSNNQSIAIQYFSDLKEKMKNDRKMLYDILDKEYKEKRFDNYEKFYNYLNNLNERIDRLDISKFKFLDNRIKIIDNYNNMYTFEIGDFMKYSIVMDDYTIEDNEFNEIYDKLSDANKVSVNIEKFIKMLNLKDYESAYKLLDSNFKKNNYPSIEAFKKYVEKNLYGYSKITTVNNSNETGNYYITSLDLEDGESENIRKKQITIIMQLLEGTDFVMSFSMN